MNIQKIYKKVYNYTMIMHVD